MPSQDFYCIARYCELLGQKPDELGIRLPILTHGGDINFDATISHDLFKLRLRRIGTNLDGQHDKTILFEAMKKVRN